MASDYPFDIFKLFIKINVNHNIFSDKNLMTIILPYCKTNFKYLMNFFLVI
jgi:hypothetical protein